MQTIFTLDYKNSFNVRLVADNHQPENDFYEYFLYIGENKYRLVCKKAFLDGWLAINKEDSHSIFSNLFRETSVGYTIEEEERYLKTASFSVVAAIKKECGLIDDLEKLEFIKTLLRATNLLTCHFY